MGRLTGKNRRVVPFSGRQTVDEREALNGFIAFACRARPELARAFLEMLQNEPDMPVKLRLVCSLEVFTAFAFQAEDVCQWVVALRDLPVADSIFDAVKNSELNDGERIQIAKWLESVDSKELLNRMTGTNNWTKQDYASNKICQKVLVGALGEFTKHEPDLRPGFPLHVMEAKKHGFIALYGTHNSTEVVSILTQGAGKRDADNKEAVFHIDDKVESIEPTVQRMEATAKAFSWLLCAVHQARFGTWPDAIQRYLAD